MTNQSLIQAQELVDRLSAEVLGKEVFFALRRDRKRPVDGRLYIQCYYTTACTVTGKDAEWSGRKWYLSDHMSDDEIVKTCYAAFKAAVEHEVMEGFKYLGKRVFNPHTPFEVLMGSSMISQYRQPSPPAKAGCAACDRGDHQLGHHHDCPKRPL